MMSVVGPVQAMVARVLAGFRGRVRQLGAQTRAKLLPWLHMGVVVGKGCRVERGCDIRVTDGGRFDIGEDTSIGSNCLLTAQAGRLSIGRRVFVGPFTTIAVRQEVVIGDDVLVAERVTIRDQDHAIHGIEGRAIARAGFLHGPVRIEAGAWIGTGAVLLRGVSIGAGAVVAANAVVRSDVPENAIAAGVPARIVGYRRGKE